MRGDQEGDGLEVDGEVLAEEDAGDGSDAAQHVQVLARRIEGAGLPVLRSEVRTAALAVAGGAIAGAATVAAVRAVTQSGRNGRRLGLRRDDDVVASRSFLVDVHVLGR